MIYLFLVIVLLLFKDLIAQYLDAKIRQQETKLVEFPASSLQESGEEDHEKLDEDF